MIKYNPLYKANGQPNGALVIAPSESIVFDLPGKATWVKGVKLKGTDHTYTFNHDNYITLTNTPDQSNPESEDIKIGVNITNLLTELDKVRIYIGENNNTAESALTTNPYIKLFYNDVRKQTFQIKSANDTNLTVTTDANGNIIIENKKPDINHNTDYRVSQLLATSSEDFRVLFKGTADDNPETTSTKFSETLLYNPSTKVLKVNSNVVIHEGLVQNKSATIGNTLTTIASIGDVDIKAKIDDSALQEQLSLILANLNSQINSINTKIQNFEELDTQVLNINGGSYNIYTSNPSLPTIVAPDSLGTAKQLLAVNTTGDGFTWIDDSIINTNIDVAWNTETTIATIHGIPIKIKIPTNPNTWRNVRINNSDEDVLTSNDPIPLVISQGNGIEVAYTNNKLIITNTAPDVDHNTHYTTALYAGDNNDTTSNSSITDPYIKLFDDSVRRSTLQLKGGNGIRVESNSGIITITNDSIEDLCRILATLKGEIHNLIPDNQLINADILSSVDLYSDNIWENGVKLTDKYLNILGSNGSITTTNNLLNNLTEVTTVNDSSYTIISGWNKVSLPNIYNYIFTRWVNDNPDLVAIEAIGNTEGFLRKLDENTWYLDNSIPETFENLCKILANLQSSISSINSKLLEFNTESLGINDAYIQKLIVEGNANIQGAITSSSFIKAGGTSVQFLKADGSVDSTDYLPLTGGILSGSITAPKFITIGGTADYFVKGDGTLDNTTYISETTWNEYQENISIILNSIHDSIKNFRDVLDTSSFGINNAYVENLIVSNTASFTNRPIIGNSEVLIDTDKMYIGTTQIPLTRTSAPLNLYDVHLVSGGTTVSDALLSNGSQSNVWLYWDAINGLSYPWGIMAKNSSSTIEFIKAGSTCITLSLSNGHITSNAFIKQDGTSSQFLKADGSVDSTTYIDDITYNADQQNLCLILNSLKGSIKNIREILDTNSFGINNAYIENLVAVNGSFTSIPSVNGTLVSLVGHTHDDRYFTETESDNRFVLKAGDTMTGNLTVPSLFVNTGDSTLKIYSGKQTDGTSDGHIGLQTCIDSQDGQTHSYASQYQAREVLALQPRGGQVYIGTMPNGGVTAYKLYVNGNIFASSFVKDGGTSSQFLKANGSVDSTEYLPKNIYDADQQNLCKILNTLQGSITSAHAKIKNLDFSNIQQLGAVNAYFDEAVVSGTLYAANNTFRADASGAYYSSDIRKKENICLLNDEDYNKIINSPDGYLKQFTWKENGNLSFGLIAQEVQEFAPEAVTQIGDYYSVNYNVALSKLLAALYRKVKEQEQIINELKMKFEL